MMTNKHIEEIIEEAGIQAFFNRAHNVAIALDKQHMLPKSDASQDILLEAIKLTVKQCAELVSDNPQHKQRLLEHFGIDGE